MENKFKKYSIFITKKGEKSCPKESVNYPEVWCSRFTKEEMQKKRKRPY